MSKDGREMQGGREGKDEGTRKLYTRNRIKKMYCIEEKTDRNDTRR